MTLIGEDSAQIAAAKRELVRIGVGHVRGAANGDIDKLAGASPLRSYRVADFTTLAAEIDRDTVTILDVRRDDEFQESHPPKAVNIPVHELSGRLNELPAGEVWVHCASGYRASVAASILDSHDRDGSGRRRVHHRREARVDAIELRRDDGIATILIQR